MKKICLNVQKEFCAECSLALSRFIGGMDGVESVETGTGFVNIAFDEARVDETSLCLIATDNIEKMGYKVLAR